MKKTEYKPQSTKSNTKSKNRSGQALKGESRLSGNQPTKVGSKARRNPNTQADLKDKANFNPSPESMHKSHSELRTKPRPTPAFQSDVPDVEPEREPAADLRAGRRVVLEALRTKLSINRILILKSSQDEALREIHRLAREQKIPVQIVEKKVLERQAGDLPHQGVIAWIAPKEYAELEDLLEAAAAKEEAPWLVALDGLEDPQNFGSILRTVEGVGAHGVLIPKRRAVPLNATAARTSAGAVDLVPVARVANLVQTLKKLKQQGCWVVGVTGESGQLYHQAELTGGIVLVFGSEGKGLSRLVQETCDFLVRIPMMGQIQSLNVSVAAGIVFYEVLRQRQAQQT